MHKIQRNFIIAGILLVGGWLLINRNEINSVGDAFRLATAQVSSIASGNSAANPAWQPTTTGVSDGRLLIASFNLHNYGKAKSRRDHILDYYSKVIKQFDVVAVQEIRSEDTNVVTKLIDRLNLGDGRWAISISPHVGRTSRKEQYAFIYNTQRVQMLGRPYLVSDPDDLINREPFVALFGCLGISPNQAFTFSLVNFHIDPRNKESERRTIPALIKEIRNDGRLEDDVILLGDLQSSDNDLRSVLSTDNLNWLLRDQKTNTQSTIQSDNLVVNTRATVEFTGRCGTFDFMREFNMTMSEALEISDHIPIWAEFSIQEGVSSGAVASGDQPSFR